MVRALHRGGGRAVRLGVRPRRVLEERDGEGDIGRPFEAHRYPVGGGAAGSHPFVPGTFGDSLADQLSCEPDVHPLIAMEMGDLSIADKIGDAVPEP